MTQPASDRRKEYPGNNVTTIFDGPRAFIASHIAVYLVTAGVATLTTAYTLTNVGGRRPTTVTMTAAPATGTTLLILRTVPYTQDTDLTNQGAYLPEVLEQALDSIEQQVQQLDDRDSRTIRLADTIVGVVSAEVQSIKPLGPVVVNAAGTGFEVGSTALTGDMLLRGELKNIYGPSLTADFGGAGDNVFDNAAAFTAAEASAHERVYLPKGTYYTTSASFQLTKHYHGPGKVRLSSGAYAPGRFTQMMVSPSKGTGSDTIYYFSGDLSRVEPEYFVLGSSNTNPRQSLSEEYFESTTTPHFEYFLNYGGGSGAEARIPGGAGIGNTSVTVNSIEGLAVGNVVRILNPATGAGQNVTITAPLAGTTVNFTPALAASYPVNSQITRGVRTMQQFRYTQLNHNGPGDAYCQTYRVNASYTPLAGQDHIFLSSTAGFFGGDIFSGTSGVFMTGMEFRASDLGNASGYNAFIQSFVRDSAVTTAGQNWIGTYFKSEGTQHCDVAHTVTGKWKRALDTVFMQPNADKAVVNMGPDQRIYFNSTGTADFLGFGHFGNIAGTSWMEYSTAVGGLNVVVNGASKIQVLPTKTRHLQDLELQAGRLFGTALHNNAAGIAGTASQFVGSGTYTPTLFNTANIAASSAFECQYLRVGNVVTVSGQLGIDPTTASVASILGISLPLASDIVGGRNLGGTACSGTVAGLFGQISGDPTNDSALLQFNVADATNQTWSFHFTYLVG